MDSYVCGLIFVRLGVMDCYVWGLVVLRLGIIGILTFGGDRFSYVC